MTHRNDLIPSEWVAVTPSDSAAVNFVGLLVTGEGDVVWKSQSASVPTTFPAAPAGTIIPGQISNVMASTTATVLGAKA